MHVLYKAPYITCTICTIKPLVINCQRSFQKLLLNSVYGACMVHFDDFVLLNSTVQIVCCVAKTFISQSDKVQEELILRVTQSTNHLNYKEQDYCSKN